MQSEQTEQLRSCYFVRFEIISCFSPTHFPFCRVSPQRESARYNHQLILQQRQQSAHGQCDEYNSIALLVKTIGARATAQIQVCAKFKCAQHAYCRVLFVCSSGRAVARAVEMNQIEYLSDASEIMFALHQGNFIFMHRQLNSMHNSTFSESPCTYTRASETPIDSRYHLRRISKIHRPFSISLSPPIHHPTSGALCLPSHDYRSMDR